MTPRKPEFRALNPRGRVPTCVVDGRVITTKDVVALAKLPSREVLLAQLVGSFQAPMGQMAGAMSALLRNFAGAVDALAKKRAETGA